MIKQKYLKQIKNQTNEFLHNREIKAFIFGSSLQQNDFGDIDIGLIGDFMPSETMQLKEKLEDSVLPYFVDVVDFNNVETSFKENILNNNILWIKR